MQFTERSFQRKGHIEEEMQQIEGGANENFSEL